MTKKRKLTSLLALFIALICTLMSLSSCNITREYSFIQEADNICSIEIVSVKYSAINGEELFICKIENIDAFLDDFSDLENHTKSPPKGQSNPTPTAIKISYDNNDYEIITSNGTIASRGETKIYSGTHYFDKDDFFKLLAKYIGSEEFPLEYNFLDRETEIKHIDIVEIGEYTDSNLVPESQEIVCRIDDHADFLIKFSKLDCFLNIDTPSKVRCNEKMIKITYSDGKYELIDVNGQSKRIDNNGFVGDDGYRYFDKIQFSSLIESYINQN